MRQRLQSGWRSRQAGFLVLIELLIVVVIIAALAAWMLSGSGGPSPGGAGGRGGPTTMPGRARDQAQSAVCRNNLQQLRTAIATSQATTGAYPADLESLQAGVPLSCPVGGEPYEYEASTGQVHCVHPGHESY